MKFLSLFQNSARLCRTCWPKISPAPLAGLQCRPLQAKGKAYAKILSLFRNSAVGAGLGSARLCRACWPKIFPRTVAGLPYRPLQAKGTVYAKILSFFQNFIVGASIARPPKPCGITRPRVEQSPTPTINRKKMRLNFIAVSQFCRRGEHCSPALAAPAALKKSPPHPWRACNAGPYKRKARLTQKFYRSFKISS